MSSCPSEVWMACTVISFLVRVPVLSEQMTVTDPSVSTAGSCLMMALRRARVCMASASEMVTTAGRPSGMMATAMETALLKALPTSSLPTPTASQEMTKVMLPMMATKKEIQRPKISSWTIRFVFMPSTPPTMDEILPISARSPVPMTIPLPWPCMTMVAEKARFFLSPRAAPPSTTSVCLLMGLLSPVSIASRIARLATSIMRRSAGTRSPDWIKTMSPGTTVEASTTWRSPPRMTVALEESMPLIASAALSALPSWMRPMVTLMMTTPRMRPTSGHSSRKADTMVAAMRMKIRMLLICIQSLRRNPGLGGGVSSFLPYCLRRLATSSSLRPSGETLWSFRDSSTVAECQMISSSPFPMGGALPSIFPDVSVAQRQDGRVLKRCETASLSCGFPLDLGR
mmetsp:Transcript_24239/g.58093  ORF Transcript_24239/g.58093 Transcript_24239/m.58093 type:complete len:400 (+) Transcript_24239:474-1673(+)